MIQIHIEDIAASSRILALHGHRLVHRVAPWPGENRSFVIHSKDKNLKKKSVTT